MIEKQFTNANKRLLIAWYLLREFESWKKSVWYKDGSMSFVPYFFTEESELVACHEMIAILQRFLCEGIIQKIHATKEQDSDGKMPVVKDVYFTSDEVAKKKEKDFLFNILPDYEGDEGFYWNLYLDLNQKRCKGYVKNYLDEWKNNVLKHEEKNLLQSRKQVGKLVYNIKKLLEDYPSVNLLFKYDNRAYEEVDFFATLFFLEKIQDIEIAELSAIEGELAFRLNIRDKFYEDFHHDAPFFNEHTVINSVDLDKIIGSSSREKVVEKIVLKAPKLLVYKGLEYEIKENKVPYHLIHLAIKKRGKVDQSELKDVSGETQARIKKALNNFRKGLREKFKFSNSELFFEQKGGLIFFKEELFDF